MKIRETLLVPVQDIKGLAEGMCAAGGNAFVIRCFGCAEGGTTIHTENLAQVSGVFPKRKYKQACYRSTAPKCVTDQR